MFTSLHVLISECFQCEVKNIFFFSIRLGIFPYSLRNRDTPECFFVHQAVQKFVLRVDLTAPNCNHQKVTLVEPFQLNLSLGQLRKILDSEGCC